LYVAIAGGQNCWKQRQENNCEAKVFTPAKRKIMLTAAHYFHLLGKGPLQHEFRESHRCGRKRKTKVCEKDF